MSEDEEMDVLVYHQYYPSGVKQVLASGTSAFIGEVDESTIFKYPLIAEGEKLDMSRIETEKRLLEIVGPHERIIALKGSNDAGLFLERAVNGNVYNYLSNSAPTLSIQQRLCWCQETAEAVGHVHSRRVLHCDIQPQNLVLDDKLHLKLCDFQGKHLAEDGTVLLDGGSAEPCRFHCPRGDDAWHADIKTDLFALGCTIYFFMMGHPVFPDIADGSDEWHERVEKRFADKQFPQDVHACSTITSKCWLLEYESAEEVLRDVEAVRKKFNNAEIINNKKGVKETFSVSETAGVVQCGEGGSLTELAKVYWQKIQGVFVALLR